MLRLLVLLIVLANGLYWAWTQGWLREMGLTPVQQAEPQRVAQQIRPDSIRLLTAEEAARPDAVVAASPLAPPPPECLQTTLLDDRQVAALRPQLDTLLPIGSWSLEAGTESARWMVYMGPYSANDALAKKKTELRQINVSFDTITKTPPGTGLSLGNHPSQAAANQQLDALARRGVRTARVLQERAEQRGQLLRLPVVDDALRIKLGDLQAALGDKTLQNCRVP
jgi:hypothetical protein